MSLFLYVIGLVDIFIINHRTVMKLTIYFPTDMKATVSVNRPAHMREVIKIIAENIPEVRWNCWLNSACFILEDAVCTSSRDYNVCEQTLVHTICI